MMSSPLHIETDIYDSSYLGNSSVHSNKGYNYTGVLLLEDAERAPEYLHLTIDSDVDEPDQRLDIKPDYKSDSEEDVIVLGEKRPTYQEITLEEDEEGTVRESVVEKEKLIITETVKVQPLYECPDCDKSFRVESLFKFHVRMHNSAVPSTNSKTTDSSSSQSSSKHHSQSSKHKSKKKKHSRRKHSDHQDKQKHKHKKHRRYKSM